LIIAYLFNVKTHLNIEVQKETVLYERLANHKVRCLACARYCEIGEGQIGLCGIRGNKDGKLVLYVYGKVAACHIDPIEKNLQLILCLEARFSQLVQLDAIGCANIASTLTSAREGKSKG